MVGCCVVSSFSNESFARTTTWSLSLPAFMSRCAWVGSFLACEYEGLSRMESELTSEGGLQYPGGELGRAKLRMRHEDPFVHENLLGSVQEILGTNLLFGLRSKNNHEVDPEPVFETITFIRPASRFRRSGQITKFVPKSPFGRRFVGWGQNRSCYLDEVEIWG